VALCSRQHPVQAPNTAASCVSRVQPFISSSKKRNEKNAQNAQNTQNTQNAVDQLSMDIVKHRSRDLACLWYSRPQDSCLFWKEYPCQEPQAKTHQNPAAFPESHRPCWPRSAHGHRADRTTKKKNTKRPAQLRPGRLGQGSSRK
jgi:hypothetical protein